MLCKCVWAFKQLPMGILCIPIGVKSSHFIHPWENQQKTVGIDFPNGKPIGGLSKPWAKACKTYRVKTPNP